MSYKFSEEQIKIALFLILSLALGARLWGINYGLPDIFFTDEWFEVKRALKLGAGVVDVDRITKGGFFYLLYFEYGLYYCIMTFLGFFSSGGDFLYSLFDDPSTAWMIGRVTNAVIGSLTCLLVYFVGKYVHSKPVGVLAAFFLAIDLIHISSSHYINVDILLTFLVLASFLVMVYKPYGQIITWKHYCLLGSIVALAIMTKITAVVLFIPILVFHYRNQKYETEMVGVKSFIFNMRLISLGLVCFIVYIVGNPGILLHAKSFIHWVVSFFIPAGLGGVEVGPEFPQMYSDQPPFLFYLSSLFPMRYFAMNFMIIGGLVVGFRSIRGPNFLFLSFIIPFFFFLSISKSVEHVYARYLLPIIPILCIYAGIACCELYKRIAYRIRAVNSFVLAFLFFLIVVFPGSIDVVSFDLSYTKPDTRSVAKQWIYENISEGSVIFIEGGGYKSSPTTVPLYLNPILISIPTESEGNVEEKSIFYDSLIKAYSNKRTYDLIFTNDENNLKSAIEENRGDYIVLRAKTKITFQFEKNRKDFPHFYSLINKIESCEYRLIKKFKPDKEIVGPELLIYKKG